MVLAEVVARNSAGEVMAVKYSGMFAHLDFALVREVWGAECGPYVNRMYGKDIPAPRQSFVAGRKHYGELKFVPWGEAGRRNRAQALLAAVRDELELNVMPAFNPARTGFDYALVHFYKNGRDHIGWHNDREALGKRGSRGTEVVSVTFLPPGAPPRPLLFRDRAHAYKGNKYEFAVALAHGDVLVMTSECQSHMKHAVMRDNPRVLKSGERRGYWHPRISVTFRQVSDGGKSNPTDTYRMKRERAQEQGTQEHEPATIA